jgi:hypothetical protein
LLKGQKGSSSNYCLPYTWYYILLEIKSWIPLKWSKLWYQIILWSSICFVSCFYCRLAVPNHSHCYIILFIMEYLKPSFWIFERYRRCCYLLRCFDYLRLPIISYDDLELLTYLVALGFSTAKCSH